MKSVTSSLAAIAAIAIPLCIAQTSTDCQPLERSDCPAQVGLNQAEYTVDLTNGVPADWKMSSGELKTSAQGGLFQINSVNDGPTLQSDFHIFFGYVEMKLQAAAGAGIISTFVMESQDLDEIDMEIIGSQTTQIQSNYFGKGNTTTYDRGAFHPVNSPQTTMHTYAVDWQKDSTKWYIDGTLVRTLNYADAVGGKNYPQTPLNIRIGNWVAGQSKNAAGVISWAGGLVDMSKAPFNMYVSEITIKNYNPCASYVYGDKSGSWQSIKCSGASSSSGSSSTSASTPVASGSGSASASSPASSGTSSGSSGEGSSGSGSAPGSSTANGSSGFGSTGSAGGPGFGTGSGSLGGSSSGTDSGKGPGSDSGSSGSSSGKGSSGSGSYGSGGSSGGIAGGQGGSKSTPCETQSGQTSAPSPTVGSGTAPQSTPNSPVTASIPETQTTVIVTQSVTTCPIGQTVTSGSITTTLETPSPSTVFLTTTSTICTKCTALPPAPSAAGPPSAGNSPAAPPAAPPASATLTGAQSAATSETLTSPAASGSQTLTFVPGGSVPASATTLATATGSAQESPAAGVPSIPPPAFNGTATIAVSGTGAPSATQSGIQQFTGAAQRLPDGMKMAGLLGVFGIVAAL